MRLEIVAIGSRGHTHSVGIIRKSRKGTEVLKYLLWVFTIHCVVCGPAALVSPKSWLEIRDLSPHSRITAWESAF